MAAQTALATCAGITSARLSRKSFPEVEPFRIHLESAGRLTHTGAASAFLITTTAIDIGTAGGSRRVPDNGAADTADGRTRERTARTAGRQASNQGARAGTDGGTTDGPIGAIVGVTGNQAHCKQPYNNKILH
ncbi:hypothetical protein CHELA20_53632 [Hyphomicrobiales bacterium]|nr:hypothetical protein CHELA41_21296 [Hyphomicrobiales bacterium]CAH1684638.1 hypothetical protein CHELA20_53632 [Hyphomicrobiales bacterium]